MKTAIYVRVSTDEQAKEGYSIRAQQDKLRDYVRIKDWELYKVYADEGLSGKNVTERPAINEMIQDIKDGKIQNVLVYKVDRLTRSTKDLIELAEIFNRHDCAFNSLMESIDTMTASGRMFLKIIGIFSEFERENIIERIKLALEKKAKEGYSICPNNPSLGYSRKKGEKIQEIVGEEAEIVREIFYMFNEENKSCHTIACELNTRGIPTKKEKIWSSATVHNVLMNCNYIGKVRYSLADEKRYFETEGKHKAIIPEEIFNETQEKLLKSAKKSLTKRPKAENYFTGTLICGICGRKLGTHNVYQKRKDGSENFIGQYRCINKLHNACTAKIMSHLKVEQAFQDYIDNIQDLNVADKVGLENYNIKKPRNTERIDEYKLLVERLLKKEKEIMGLYISAKLDFNEYNQMVNMIKAEKQLYTEQLNNLEVSHDEAITITTTDIITNLHENWTLLTKKEKMQFIKTFIEQIVIINEAIENKLRGRILIMKVDFY